MKTFILKILSISLIILVIFSIMNILFINSSYFTIKLVDWKRYRHVPVNLEIVNLGNSHGANGFIYTDYENCYNFANNGQSFKTDLQVFKQFEDRLKDNALVIIPVSYVSFSKIDEATQKKNDLRYYQILKPRHIMDFSISDYVMYKIFPLLTVDKEIFDAIKKELSSSPDTEKTLADYTNEELVRSQEGYKSFLIDHYSYDSGHLLDLCNLIEFIVSKNMTPILTTVPVADVFTDMCTDEIMNDFHQATEYILDNYKIQYYDYSSHPDFYTDYELFKDSSHMSIEGGEKFTQAILSQITIN